MHMLNYCGKNNKKVQNAIAGNYEYVNVCKGDLV